MPRLPAPLLRTVTLLTTAITAVFAIIIGVQWLVLILWFAPAVLGVYILMTGRLNGIGPRYVGAALLALSWAWASLLGRHILPSVSRFTAAVLSMPFQPDQFGGGGEMLIPLGMLTAFGCGALTNVVATHASWRRPTRDARIVRYRVVGAAVGLGCAGVLYFAGHHVIAAFAAGAAAVAVALYSSSLEDPAEKMAEYS